MTRVTALGALVAVIAPTLGAAPSFQEVSLARGLDFVVGDGTAFAVLEDPIYAMVQRTLGNGAAVGDVDGDGDLDVYLLGQLGEANRLFRNDLELGAPGFTEATPAVLADEGLSRVAHIVDLDGDGRRDVVLINDESEAEGSRSRIFAQRAGGVWEDVTADSGFHPAGFVRAGCAIADYDRDGRLDLYVTVWTSLAGAPESNRLYRNLGGFRFEDVTETVGLGTLDRDSFTAIFTDFEQDLRPDLYVAIDHSSDAFFRNQAGAFTDVTSEVGATHGANDMGVAVADFDDDDDLDLFVTNIHDPDDVFGPGQINVFYVDRRTVPDTVDLGDEAAARGVADVGWGWGTEFVDLELDGDLDLVAVNGMDEYVFEFTGGDSALYRTPTVVFENDGSGAFSRLGGIGLDEPLDSRGLVAFDYDRDGDRDLLVTNVGEPVRLYENTTVGAGHWLTVRLEPDGLAIGAQVRATAGATTWRRDVVAGRSYLVGTPAEAHFGLGTVASLETLRVRWADGIETVLEDVAVDRVLTLDRGIPFFADGFESGALDGWSEVSSP